MNNVVSLWSKCTNARVTVADMAEILNCSQETIRRYIRFERVPADCWVQNAKGEYLIDAHAFIAALPWVTVNEFEETTK